MWKVVHLKPNQPHPRAIASFTDQSFSKAHANDLNKAGYRAVESDFKAYPGGAKYSFSTWPVVWEEPELPKEWGEVSP